MNKYKKYCPNVFIAECENEYKKDDVIILTTQYGKEHECIVHNSLAYNANTNLWFYSITRADGFNTQERAKNKANKYQEWADKAKIKSDTAYNSVNQERGFLSLGEPIKIGHHSERGHRNTINKVDNAIRKSIEFDNKADNHIDKVDYWRARENDINLSMPESIEFYETMLTEATETHTGIKNGTIRKQHSYSLTYANKRKKDMQAKYEIAKKLWG